jgi:hypothetical protein
VGLLFLTISGQDPHQLCECDGTSERHWDFSISILIPGVGFLRQLPCLRDSTRLHDATIPYSKIPWSAGNFVGVSAVKR